MEVINNINVISDFLKENDFEFRRGVVISIKHVSIFEPILSVVQKVEGSLLCFRVPNEFLKSNVLKGDSISCHILQDNYEYVITGIINDIELQYPYFVQVYIEKKVRFNNNRASKRFMVNFSANIDTKNHNAYAIIKNISQNGVAAVFKEHIDIDGMANMRVLVQVGRTEILEFKVCVLRSTPKNSYSEYGMNIIEIDDKNKNLLDKLLFRLQVDETSFISESLK
jgi:hypothetical protein